MKRMYILLLSLSAVALAQAQAPQQFNYQAVARDIAGNVLPNHSIVLRTSILNAGPSGTKLYQETFALTTNPFGLVSVAIGSGTPVSGNFSTIDWATSSKYLAAEIDFKDGKGFQLMGTSQLLSVPFALYAQNSGSNNAWSASDTNIFNGNTGNVGIGTNTPQTKLHVQFGSSLITGWDPINLPVKPALAPGNGAGSRQFWYLDKSAFRTGGVDDGAYGTGKSYTLPNANHFWDKDSIGQFSLAAGYNVLASGIGSAAVGGGNRATGDFSFAGGLANQATGTASTAFGQASLATGYNAIALGTFDTAANTSSAAIGFGNSARGLGSFAAGHINAAPGNHSVAMGEFNQSAGTASVALGSHNIAQGNGAFTSGTSNAANGSSSFASGSENFVFADNGTAMGNGNRIAVTGDEAATIGSGNSASGSSSIAMGNSNFADGDNSIAIGTSAIAVGQSSIAIGSDVLASGEFSTAMGSQMSTNSHIGAFMIGDNSDPENFTTAGVDNQFIARFAGGYFLMTTPDAGGPINGVQLFPGDNAWSQISDSTKKTGFLRLDGEKVLDKLAAFDRLGSWTYKGQDPKTFRHYGPMAQDFHQAFGFDGIGTMGNDTTINSGDISGILFIAAHALAGRTNEMNKKVSLQECAIGQLQAANSQLKEENKAIREQYARANEALNNKLALLEAQLNKLSVQLTATNTGNGMAAATRTIKN